MLTFIGLGLSYEKGLTLEAMDALNRADIVLLETYTSPLTGKIKVPKAQEVSRSFVEDGRKILGESADKNVILLCYGDPMVATTHMDLRVRAEKNGIRTKVIHNASILSAIPGETGLHSYKFGRTVTMTRAPPAKNVYVYHSLHSNLLNGLHSLILLEYDSSSNFFLDPKGAIDSLLETEEEQKKLVVPPECFMVVCSRIGQSTQKMVGGKASSLSKKNFGKPPHAIVLPGGLHYTEEESLRYVCRIKNNIINNSARVKLPGVEMVNKYIVKAKTALERARLKAQKDGKRFDSLFENMQLYTLDAERFLYEGNHELAILSIGYAEGLLDSLNFTDQLEVEW